MYDTDEGTVIDFLAQRPEKLKSIGLVIHNQTATRLANLIGDLAVENVPTSGVYSVAFNCDHWSDVRERRGHTARYAYIGGQSSDGARASDRSQEPILFLDDGQVE